MKQVHVRNVQLLPDGGVIVFLTDGTSFEYDLRTQMWSVLASHSLESGASSGFTPLKSHASNRDHPMNGSQGLNSQKANVSQVIKMLEQQTLEEQVQLQSV